MADRNTTRSAGFVSLAEVPEDRWVAGIAVVTLNEEGGYDVIFQAESLDNVPDPEVQEILGPIIAQAWALANNSGLVEID